jgi:hypothetical protein
LRGRCVGQRRQDRSKQAMSLRRKKCRFQIHPIELPMIYEVAAQSSALLRNFFSSRSGLSISIITKSLGKIPDFSLGYLSLSDQVRRLQYRLRRRTAALRTAKPREPVTYGDSKTVDRMRDAAPRTGRSGNNQLINCLNMTYASMYPCILC